MVNSVKKETQTTIELSVLELSIKNQEQFVQALIEPYEPNDVMKRAAQRHKALIGEV